jgi:hypothetical protein
MQHMLDRVADAIRDDYWEQSAGSDPNWHSMARAAIAAMRNPTTSMIESGTIPGEIGPSTAAEIYRDMIDDVLVQQRASLLASVVA